MGGASKSFIQLDKEDKLSLYLPLNAHVDSFLLQINPLKINAMRNLLTNKDTLNEHGHVRIHGHAKETGKR